METPEDTTPQAKAHMGGNQVIGCSTSSTAEGAGRVAAAVGTVSVVIPG
jgi:hypothetical protein